MTQLTNDKSNVLLIMCSDCVNSSAANNVYSPNISSVVSDNRPREELVPPNKTISLKVGPYPNRTAECLHRGVIATGRLTCN